MNHNVRAVRRVPDRCLGTQVLDDDGETRIRTGDTTIFSRVLYQLSYLAVLERPTMLPSRRSGGEPAAAS